MPKGLRVVLYSVGGLVGLVLVLVLVVYSVSSAHMAKVYEIASENIVVPSDSGSVAQGKHIAITRGCRDCHGENLQGGVIINDPAMGYIAGPNLTGAEGSATAEFNDADWVRAIRHGVGKEGLPLIMMPSGEYYYLSDEDLGDLIAYLKSLEPIDNDPGMSKVGPLGRALYTFGQMPTLLHAELIDHNAPHPEAPPMGETIEYGEYLAKGCTGCHGVNLAGGAIVGAPPSWPKAANLTPDESGMKGWTHDDFVTAMREGVRPDGVELNPIMPWQSFKSLKDVELNALWLYVSSLEPRAYAQN